MSALSHSSCYRKLLTFAASAVVGLLGISAEGQESATLDGSKTAPRSEARAKPNNVDDKPSKPGEGPAPSPATDPSPPLPADASPDANGSAPKPAPVAVDGTAPSAATASGTGQGAPPAETPTKAPTWHKVQFRLSGSMCLACLKEMKEELSKVPGIYRIKVERPQTNYFQPVSPDVASWANAVVLYDSERLPIEYLRGAIKQLGYHSYRVVDRLLGREPDERDLKI